MAQLNLRLAPDTSELSTMRRKLREQLRSVHEAPGDWLIVATELATNSIHASPGDRPIELRLTVHPDRIELKVIDEGPGYDPASAPTATPPPSSFRGRGLSIVRALADRFEVQRVEGKTASVVQRRRSARKVDVAVIGLGSAGEAASNSLASAGRSVVGFEPERVGGECPFVACMPSKSILHDAHRARDADDPGALWDAAVERRRDIADGLDDSNHADRLVGNGVELVRARARLAGPNTVVADGQSWEADHVLLATGSAPVIPDIEGLEPERVWTAFDALTSDELPSSLLIIGAGAVGCELSDVYSSFGADVVLIDHADRLLPDHDADVSACYRESLCDLGIDVRTNTGVERIRHGDRTSSAVLTSGEQVEVDRILVASGQQPRLHGLGLDAAGLDADAVPEIGPHREIVGHEGLWMLGDMNGENPWTHGANRDAAIVTAAITGERWSRTNSAMPRAVFTDPPAAHVGIAADHDNGYLRGIGRYRDIARMSTDQLDDGLVVIAVEPGTGVIAGCSAVGPMADEIIATATALVHFEIAVTDARTQVFAFPTVSQVLEVAISDAADRFVESQAA